ncbi:MAG: N-acetyltransferase [Sphingobacteriia bacterium]|nr:N-acetyltransferase [Sphingobacteriia bacterium]
MFSGYIQKTNLMGNPEVHNLLNNEDLHRFELYVDNEVAFIDYIMTADKIYILTHTEVPKALRGRDIGKTLVRKTLDQIKMSGFRLVPLCPFIAGFVKDHSCYKDIVSKIPLEAKSE